jgi:hypothetical protein
MGIETREGQKDAGSAHSVLSLLSFKTCEDAFVDRILRSAAIFNLRAN